MPLCKHQVRPMGWSPRRAETCLAPFRALPCTMTVTTRIGGEVCTQPQLPLSTDSLERFQTRVLSSHSCIRLFVALVYLDRSEDLRCLGNLSRKYSFSLSFVFFFSSAHIHAHTHVDTHSFLYVIPAIHCIHRYYFDLRIYTISDTTLHALTVDTI